LRTTLICLGNMHLFIHVGMEQWWRKSLMCWCRVELSLKLTSKAFVSNIIAFISFIQWLIYTIIVNALLNITHPLKKNVLAWVYSAISVLNNCYWYMRYIISYTYFCRYLFLFLKFMASVIPTIEYDYTMDFDLGSSSNWLR